MSRVAIETLDKQVETIQRRIRDQEMYVTRAEQAVSDGRQELVKLNAALAEAQGSLAAVREARPDDAKAVDAARAAAMTEEEADAAEIARAKGR